MEDSSSQASFLANLLCSEVLPNSPAGTSSSAFFTNPSDGSYDLRRPRTVPIDYDAEMYCDRALNRKIAEQQISLDIKSWCSVLGKRQAYWRRAFEWYRRKSFSQASLQMAISFVDRFMTKFTKLDHGNVNEAPLDCIFEAALIIIGQLLDDDPDLENLIPVFSESLCGRSSNKAVNTQVVVKLMLQVTRWEVIDWTPASFIPHYLEEAQLRQAGDSIFQQQILAVATLFMMDAEVCSRVPPSAIAALAVIIQSYLFVDCFFRENPSTNADICDPATFLLRTVDVVIRIGKMTKEYFHDMTDYALTRLLESNLHDGFDSLTAARFCGIWKATFRRSLRLLETSVHVESMEFTPKEHPAQAEPRQFPAGSSNGL